MLVCNVTVGRRRERVPAVAPVASAAGCCACAAAIVVAAAVVRRERGRARFSCPPPHDVPYVHLLRRCRFGIGWRTVPEGSPASNPSCKVSETGAARDEVGQHAAQGLPPTVPQEELLELVPVDPSGSGGVANGVDAAAPEGVAGDVDVARHAKTLRRESG